MAKHSVNVLIKARDEASRKFLRVGGAAKIMGRMLKGVGSTIKTALVTALKAAKYAAIALGVALVGCTAKALKQEAAEFELASALKITGQYSDAMMEKLKAEAAAIQDVTVYGDEYIMSLQRMALTLGVTADEASNAAKAAIAFHAGFGGGKGKPEIFLRYYIDFLRGTGTSLASYVGELRKAKTEEEKHIILLKAMAYGYDVATSKAKTTEGALTQMKNILYDVTEVISAPFLPAIKSSAQAITLWAKENMLNIAWWAQKTFSAVTLVKDVFVEFAQFMKADWFASFRFALGAPLIEFRTFGKSLLIISKKIFADLHNQMTVSIRRSVTGWLMRQSAEAEYLRKHRGKRIGGLYEKPLTWELIRKSNEYAARQMEAVEKTGVLEKMFPRKKTTSWKIIGDQLAEAQKEAMKEIAELMPAEFRKGVEQAFDKLERRLEKLGPKPGKWPPHAIPMPGLIPFIVRPGEPSGAEAPTPFAMPDISALVKEARSEAVRKLAPLEARFLTFKPGATFDYECRQVTLLGQNVQNTKNMVTGVKELIKDNKALFRQIKRFFEKWVAGPQLATTSFI